jgi:hypothetical protein
MADEASPSAEEIVLYDKDPCTKIATITLNRPDRHNAPTIARARTQSPLGMIRWSASFHSGSVSGERIDG